MDKDEELENTINGIIETQNQIWKALFELKDEFKNIKDKLQ